MGDPHRRMLDPKLQAGQDIVKDRERVDARVQYAEAARPEWPDLPCVPSLEVLTPVDVDGFGGRTVREYSAQACDSRVVHRMKRRDEHKPSLVGDTLQLPHFGQRGAWRLLK